MYIVCRMSDRVFPIAQSNLKIKKPVGHESCLYPRIRNEAETEFSDPASNESVDPDPANPDPEPGRQIGP
jgi:hypothetical protein